MNNDIMPSVITACFTTPKAFENLKKGLAENGLKMRELKIIDIGVPLETEKYEKAVNYLRTFTKPILSRFIQNIPFKGMIEKQLKKQHLEFFDYENFENQPDFKNPMAFAGFTPIAIDTKYNEHYSDEEKANLIKLKTFASETFKPTPLKEQGIIEEDDPAWDLSNLK